MTFYTDSFPDNATLVSGKRMRGGFMHRCSTGILIILLTSLLGLLTGCLGSSTRSSSSQSIKSVGLSPTGIQSIDIGTTQNFSASATDSLGRVVPGVSIQFVVTSGDSNPAPLSINLNGAGCAGTWNPTGTVCSPGSPGIAIVTAIAEGVSSAQATVFVHQHINRIQVTRVDPTPPPHACFSQGNNWDYRANVYDINNVDITNSVGPINWAAQNATVMAVDSVAGLPANQVQVTAKAPGISQLSASVSGATSSPLSEPFTTCLVDYIRLQIEGSPESSFSINSGSKIIQATVVDTQGVTIANPPLTWSSSNPEVASFSTAANTTGSNTLTARTNGGSTNVTASCTPPTCNIGVLPALPVYASNGKLPIGGQPVGPEAFGVISANITPTKIPTYSAWAATNQCGTQLNCQSIAFEVTPGQNPVGVSAVLPRTPNSMIFNEQGTRIYFGSDQGLMFLDVTASSPSITEVSNASTPCSASLCGKVLAVSPAGNRVVVADSISTPHQVYIFNSSSTSGALTDLVLNNPAETAVAAAFSPDELKIFILTDKGNLYVFSSVDGLNSISIGGSASDLAFSADGSFAYVAGTPTAASVTGYSTCSPAGFLTKDLGTSVLSGVPLKIFASQSSLTNGPVVVQNVIALEPPIIEVLTGQFTQDPVPIDPNALNQFTCNPPIVSSLSSVASVNLGQGNFSPLYMRVVADGSAAVVVANNVPAVLFVDLNQQIAPPLPLVNNGLPLAASASSDGSQVYVAACDVYTNNDPNQCLSGSVHIVNRLTGGDTQQVPYVNFNTNNSMCTIATAPPCFPNMIAIKAQ